nr:tetratricopeptide repeat protein [uncultured Bacteroides sp.]
MRINFTILISFFLLFSKSLSAQTVEQIMPNISHALAEQHWNEASNLFHIAVDKDLYKSEKFFLDSISLNCPARAEMLYQLGFYCKHTRNYEKAYVYYKELLQLKPNDVSYLVPCAELEVVLGKEDDALKSYEKILALDNNNLAANIYIGNYYFFTADKEKRTLDKEFKKVETPTRMQYANYRNELARLVTTEYEKAKAHLEKVISQFPSSEAKKTLDKIHSVELESNK